MQTTANSLFFIGLLVCCTALAGGYCAISASDGCHPALVEFLSHMALFVFGFSVYWFAAEVYAWKFQPKQWKTADGAQEVETVMLPDMPPTPQCRRRAPSISTVASAEGGTPSTVSSPTVSRGSETPPFASFLGADAPSPDAFSEVVDTGAGAATEDDFELTSYLPTRLSAYAGRRLRTGFAKVLASRLKTSNQLVVGEGTPTSVLAVPPWRRTRFHSTEASSQCISEYLREIHWYFDCSAACLPIALIYIDRVCADGRRIVFNDQTCHRLLLTCLVLALKFHDDEPPYYNTFYAESAGVSMQELNAMERQLCSWLDWRLSVQVEEFDWYRNLLMESA